MVTTVRGVAAYRRVEAQSRSPLELVVMLYDGVLRFVTEARVASAANDAARRGHAVSRALAIVGELQSTLDLDGGGATAQELDRLYTYVTERFLDVTVKQDASALEEIQRLIVPLRDAWADIARQAGAPLSP